MRRPAPPDQSAAPLHPFDQQLLSAINELKSSDIYKVMLPWDSFFHGNGYADKKARCGLVLKYTKKGLYWFAFRYKTSRKCRETLARRCTDDHHPGSSQDTAYQLLYRWSQGEDVAV